MKEDMEGLLDGKKGSADEVVKLQQLVGDLQQQLVQQNQDVKGWVGALADSIDSDDGVMGRLDFLVTMLMAVRSEGVDTPQHACVLPPREFAEAHGLFKDEQTPEVWVKRLEYWREDDFKDGMTTKALTVRSQSPN